MKMPPIIDTHLHIWDLSRFRLPELDSYEELRRDFLLSDLSKALDQLNIEKIVYMEVNLIQEQKYSEALYITDLCKREDNPIGAAFLGGNPLSYSFRDYAPLFKDNQYVKGVRHVLHPPEVKEGHCLERDFVNNVRLLGALGLKFSICIRPSELKDAVKLAGLCPETSFILDHCGNGVPAIVNGSLKEKEYPVAIFRHDRDQWLRDIESLSKRPNVICKISGLLFKTDKESLSPELLAPSINHCLDTFGPDRVIFGSNWPVCTLTTSYAKWLNVLLQVLESRSEEQKLKLFYKNAERLYGL